MGSKASKNQSQGTTPLSTVLQPFKPLTKPLTYPSLVSVVEFISFGRRKQLYAKCPTIRKLEERLPYHLERVEIRTGRSDYIVLKFDNFSIGNFGSNNDSNGKIAMWCPGKRVERSTGQSLYEATEKFALYNLSRPGTRIKTLKTKDTPKSILNCIPLTIENLIVNNFIIHTDILSEWNCGCMTIEGELSYMEVVDYCWRVSKRTDRPIRSVLKSGLSGYSTVLFKILSRELNARKIRMTVFGGNVLEFASIPINESTELHVSMMKPGVLKIKVCARRTAIDHAF
ncbi:hypothetical protein GCK72_021200 [Caenorhabditis remanei]|uniref:DUF38 domain-containing protein n=1 Tax=Caenorhabditis remanei TaxID=31234 RepID=A0A6A5GHD1_CAERE|nr:hypothetical protein GCK72_021200 [Caenorhabditis remanei]KAF1754637.1 hypothetical protein GCK72_021200 [Caenorhabditis remanei]